VAVRPRSARLNPAAVGAALFFLVGPGLEAGVAPWLLTSGFEVRAEWPVPLRVLGVLLIVGGLVVVIDCFRRFVIEGLGTPAPSAPPPVLVVRGAYRFVRNPMYVATAAIIVGEGLLLGQPILLVGAAAYVLALAGLVRFHEERVMRERFGAEYDEYRRRVPAWVPRLSRP
jgi:protein-S-isoprenylcysteine O-methyltransferase Ste14